METKICKKCEEEKPLKKFPSKPPSQRGIIYYDSLCYVCRYLVSRKGADNPIKHFRPFCDEKSEQWFKKCSFCKEDLCLNAENFSIQTKTALGFSAECRKCLRKRNKKHREVNKEKLRIQTRDYRRNNREWASRVNKKDYEKNKLARLSTVKRYRQNNPDKCQVSKERSAAKNAARRARLQNAGGNYSKIDVKRIYTLQNGKCLYCEIEVGNKYHVDHIVPLVRGGTNSPDNICIACKQCNLDKGIKLVSEWKPDFDLCRIDRNLQI